jgi:predicted RecB family endonuclease
MARRTPAAVERSAVDALIGALGSLGVNAGVSSVDVPECDLVAEVAGRRFAVEVKSVITSALGQQLARDRERGRLPLLVVADRIASVAKRSFREAGINYFDRRGELRIVDPPLVIDTVVESAQPIAVGPGGSLDSQVAKEVAIACLLAPDQPHGVREIARYVDRAPSAVSNAMAGLRDDGLLTSEGEAMVPDLFHELIAVWRRRPVSLSALPDPDARSAMRLGLGIHQPEETIGWALTDTLAAASWGMPIVARGDHPPDFYVPSESELRAARSGLGDASDPNRRACTVAVAPVRLACLRRLDHSKTTGERWPVANHIIVALDVAQDRARGLEALEQWQPDGIVRAW